MIDLLLDSVLNRLRDHDVAEAGGLLATQLLRLQELRVRLALEVDVAINVLQDMHLALVIWSILVEILNLHCVFLVLHFLNIINDRLKLVP